MRSGFFLLHFLCAQAYVPYAWKTNAINFGVWGETPSIPLKTIALGSLFVVHFFNQA
jgi:hypothetical protein